MKGQENSEIEMRGQPAGALSGAVIDFLANVLPVRVSTEWGCLRLRVWGRKGLSDDESGVGAGCWTR